MKVFVYCRVGCKDQLSLNKQFDELRSYAEKNNHDIIGESSDIGVYNTMDRPGFQPLIEKLNSGEVDAVMIRDITRISRDFTITAQFVDNLISHKAKLLCVFDQIELGKERLIDSLTPEMRLAINLS